MLGIAASPANAVANAVIVLRRITPTPVLTGVPLEYELFFACGAVSDPVCVNSRVELAVPANVQLSVRTHPYVRSSSSTPTGHVIQLDPAIPAGSTSRLTFTLTAANGIFPSSTFAVNATMRMDNAAPATSNSDAAVTASSNPAIEKILVGTGVAVDGVARYDIRTCTANTVDLRFGQLWFQTGQVVDSLPTNAVYVNSSAGGVYDATARTVTWSGLTNLNTNNCSPTNPPTQWIELRYPSPTFTPSSSVTNNVAVTGTPYTQTVAQTVSTSVTHGFLSGTPTGTSDKYATSDFYCGISCPPSGNFYPDDRPEATWAILMRNTSAVPAEFDVVDMMPCAEVIAANTYASKPVDVACPHPLFYTERLNFEAVQSYYGSSVDFYPAIKAAYQAGWRPQYLSATGLTGTFETTDLIKYTPVGLAAGDRISQVRLPRDSRFSFPANTSITMRMEGYVPSDIPDDAYIDGARPYVYNSYQFHMYSGATTVVNQSDPYWQRGWQKVTRPTKIVGHIGLSYYYNGGSMELILRNTSTLPHAMVGALLLPAGISATSSPSIGGREGVALPGNVPVANAFSSETIPNFQGTGRTLVRVFTKPGFQMSAFSSVSAYIYSQPLNEVYPPGPVNYTTYATFPGDDADLCDAIPLGQGSAYAYQGTREVTDPLDIDGDGRTAQVICTTTRAGISQGSAGVIPSLRTSTYLKGDLDAVELASPNAADISDGGQADFRIDVQNQGTTPLTNAWIYDILPYVGDTGVSASTASVPRGSAYQPNLVGPVTVSGATTVEYSTSTNPCRPELDVTTTCDTVTWVTSPTDWTTVRSFRVLFATLAGGARIPVRFSLKAPNGTAAGDVAWNNVGATASDGGSQLVPTDSARVGMGVPLTDISIATTIDSPASVPGETRTVTVKVRHDTTITASNFGQPIYGGPVSRARNVVAAVTLPTGLSIVPGSIVGAGFNTSTGLWNVGDVFVNSSETLSFQVRAATVGTRSVSGEIVANSVLDLDSTPNDCATTTGQDDCASVQLQTSVPAIGLRAMVEEPAGSGTYIDANDGSGVYGNYRVGQPIRYRFAITNTGPFLLSNIQLIQPALAALCDLTVTGSILPGDTKYVDCLWSVGRVAGVNVTTANVHGDYQGLLAAASDNATVDVTVPATPPTPGLTVNAVTVNNNVFPTVTGDAIYAEIGQYLIWQYDITNTGTDTLAAVEIINRFGNPVNPNRCERSDGSALDEAFLPGVTISCVESLYALDGGEFQNITARAYTTAATVISASDGTSYVAGTPEFTVDLQVKDPAIGLFVQAAPGDPSFPKFNVGDPVSWQFIITNTGTLDIPDLTSTWLYNTSCDQTSTRLNVGATIVVPCESVFGGRLQEYASARSAQFSFSRGDSAVIDPFRPSIQVQLLAENGVGSGNFVDTSPSDDLARAVHSPGDTVLYNIIVTNTGDKDLTNVVVDTPQIPSCRQTVASLPVGLAVLLDCTQIEWISYDPYVEVTTDQGMNASDYVGIQMLSADPATNLRIYLDVKDHDGNWVSGGDYDPFTDISDPIPVVLVGDTLDWRVRLVNVGTDPVPNVLIRGDAFSACDQPSQTIAGGASLTFTCTTGLANASVLQTITVRAHGQEFDRNDANVGVIAPPAVPTGTIDLQVFDPASGTYVDADDRDNLVPVYLSGSDIRWRVVVRNTGTVAIAGLTIGDIQTACGPVNITGLDVGATVTQECTTTASYNRRANLRAEGSGTVERSITMSAAGMPAATDIARVFVSLPAAIGDQVWYDADGSDTLNGDERGIAGVTVRLFLGGVERASTTTDANGSYRFDNLLPGDYTITFDIPTGHFLTTGPARATTLGLAQAGSLATVQITVSSGDIRPDISLGVRTQALDAPVNTPTPTTTTTTPTPPAPPTVPARAGLPSTGTDTIGLLNLAGLLLLVGAVVITANRFRRRQNCIPLRCKVPPHN